MPAFTKTDSAYMARALRLAKNGRYSAHPNPVVGCVIAKDGAVVGEGWHRRAGDAHAEVNALANAGSKAADATVYVTLEPCSHHGKTPPCADALIDAGIARVVVATEDPYQRVAGGGIQRLVDAGIEVAVGLMTNSAQNLVDGFINRVTQGRPLVRLKIAASIDGAIAMQGGESQWITGPGARADVQRLRARSGAIMTGVGTVLADDPSLTVRDDSIDRDNRQPLRVVIDSTLRTPASARILAQEGQTLLCSCGDANADGLARNRVEIMSFNESDGRVDVSAVLDELGRREINDVLVEAGPVLSGFMLTNDLVDELVIYQAPHIMGSETRGMFATPSWTSLADRRQITVRDVRRFAADTRITATIDPRR